MNIWTSSSQLTCALFITIIISGCAGQTSENKNGTITNASRNIVLMDPRIDDAMLPALGEGLSKGAVTIYSLDGQNQPLPIDVVQQQNTPPGGPRPIINQPDFGTGQFKAPAQSSGNPVSITRPDNIKKGNNDPRVMLFNPDSGTQIGIKKEMTRPPATDPDLRPPLLPPPLSDKTQPLKSPFTGSGALAPRPDTTTWNPPPVTMGSDRRTVISENLMGRPTMPPPLPLPESSGTKTIRPPKGMTY